MGIEVDHDATRRELETDQGVLRYHEAGEGPAAAAAPRLRAGRHGLAQLPGHHRHLRRALPLPGARAAGLRGQRPRRGPPAADGAGTVLPLPATELGIERTHVIGNSMGGIIALAVAMKEPGPVDRLVTIGGVGRNIFSPGPGEGINLLMEFTDDPTREKLVQWLHSMVFDRRWSPRS
jgi:pimeloyl-ACP methyl ester carboxylesterase